LFIVDSYLGEFLVEVSYKAEGELGLELWVLEDDTLREELKGLIATQIEPLNILVLHLAINNAKHMNGVSPNIDPDDRRLLILVHITVNLMEILKERINPDHDVFYFVALKKLLHQTLPTVNWVGEGLTDDQGRVDLFIWPH
jgi:hypothetical protein